MGNCRFSQGNLGTDKLFTGQRLDATGLYYYNARYYDAIIGRFISPDTVGQNLNDPQSLNRYTYCSNNPLNRNDPTGHWPNFVNIAKNIGSAIKSAVNTAVNVAKQVTETVKQAEIAAAKSVSKGVVTAAVYATGMAVKIAQTTGENPINKVCDTVVEGALNHTVVPLVNKITNAGITDISINSSFGYVETDFSNGGWAASLLNTLSGTGTAGTTVDSPWGSAVFINQDKSNMPTARRHEETHVIQQQTLGWPLFDALYYLADWAYGGYANNPFEKQAYDPYNEDPSNWHGIN